MWSKFSIIGVVVFFIPVSLISQTSSQEAYEFLSLPSSARETALGGSAIAVVDEDISLAFSNPASLNPLMHNRINFNYNFHFAGISNGFFSYGRTVDKWKATFHGGIKYIDYGNFTGADEFGNIGDTFSAGEISMFVGGSYMLNKKLRIGSNIKFVQSDLAGYNSFGLAGDLGMVYYDEERRLVLSAVIKNAGSEISSYRPDLSVSPIDIQLGLSKRLKHLPFRVGVVMHHLHRWDVRYDSVLDQEVDILGEAIESGAFSKFADNFFRHFIFNGEFLFGSTEVVRLRLGYNHMRRKELSVSGLRSLAGFSLGLGIKVSSFRLDYGVGYHHLAGGVNHISISTDLDSFFKKKI